MMDPETTNFEPVPLQRYEGPSFELLVPTTWLQMATSEYQAIFVGPKIGDVRATVTVTMAKRNESATFSDLVNNIRNSQKDFIDYVVLNEEEIPGEFPFMSRYCQWYDPKTDVVMFQKQLLMLVDDFAYVVGATQPNHDRVDELGFLFSQILASFQAGRLNI